MDELVYCDFESKKNYQQLKEYIENKVEYLRKINLDYKTMKEIIFDDNFNKSILSEKAMNNIKIYFKRLIIYQQIKRA